MNWMLPSHHIDRVYVTVGGGGLVSGIASWLKYHQPHVEIIGCQPVNSPEMYLSTLAGHVVNAPESRPTLSDGSAGPLEEDSITFGICQALIDRFILITEEEIKAAIRYLYQNQNLVVEGAAGVAMAAAMKDTATTFDSTSVVILCGGNIDPALHRDLFLAITHPQPPLFFTYSDLQLIVTNDFQREGA